MLTVPPRAREAWRALADALDEHGPPPCTHDPEAWHTADAPPRDAHTRAIRAGVIADCRACPARTPCLTYALAAREDSGIWGGLTTTGRGTLRRHHARTDPGPELP